MFKNIFLTVLIKVLSAGVMLLSVPLLLGVLGVEKYGVWAALTSVITWVLLFDFGAGLTVKNSISKAVGSGDFDDVTQEIIKTIRFLSIVSMLLISIFTISIYVFEFLKTNKLLALVLIAPFILVYPLTIGTMILQGARKFYLNSLLALAPQLCFLIFVYLCSKFNIDIELIQLALVYTCLNVCSVLLVWFVSLKNVKLKLNGLENFFTGPVFFGRLKTALRFFILQLSSLFLYSMGTILTIDNLTSEAAAQYDVANKVYLFGLTLFNVAVSVFWSEFVIYIEKKDYKKLLNTYFVFLLIAVLFSVGTIIFSLFSPQLIELWTGGHIVIDRKVAMVFGCLVSIQAISYCGAAVLNSFEDISFQMYMSVAAAAAMIPLCKMFFSDGLGIISFPAATILLSIPALFYCNLRAYILIRERIHASQN